MPGTIVAHTESAILGSLVRMAMETQQRCHLRIGDEYDVSAIATITPVGTREGLELFTPHRNAPIAAVSGSKVERDVVNECGHVNSISFAVVGRG
jgi:hypothetical protein